VAKPRIVLPLSLSALLMLPALVTVGAAAVPGLVHGNATAATFTIYSDGVTFSGGAFDRTIECVDCLARFTFTDSSITVSQNGLTQTLSPGAYELREYRGTIAISYRGPHNFFIQLEGAGHLAAL